MRRVAVFLAGAAAMVLATAAMAQSINAVEAVQFLISGLEPPPATEYTVIRTTEGAANWEDERLDLEHPTGQPPGFNAQFVDISAVSASTLEAGPIEPVLFGSTMDNPIWPETEAGSPAVGPVDAVTITGATTGNGLDRGDVALFGIDLGATPPMPVEGVCEYTVWAHDSSNPNTFTNLDGFPNDPAVGTNTAFGFVLNPLGEAVSSTFSLVLTDDNTFAQTDVDVDVRAFIAPKFVGILVPEDRLATVTDVNFYSACVSEGTDFDPANSASDQTGLLTFSTADLGEIAVTEVSVAQTTTTAEEENTAAGPDTTTQPEEIPTAAESTSGTGALPWLLILAVLAGSGVFWVMRSRGGPCSDVIREAQSAAKACQRAKADRLKAEEKADRAEQTMVELGRQRSELISSWPPLGWDTTEGPSMEDGRGLRVTARDVHMRRIALGPDWDEYRAGRLTVSEVEAMWAERGGADFIAEFEETDSHYHEQLDAIDATLKEASAEAERVDGLAYAAERTAETACAESARLQRLVDDCESQQQPATQDSKTLQ